MKKHEIKALYAEYRSRSPKPKQLEKSISELQQEAIDKYGPDKSVTVCLAVSLAGWRVWIVEDSRKVEVATGEKFTWACSWPAYLGGHAETVARGLLKNMRRIILT